MAIKLPKDARERAVASIARYFRERLEREIGNLDAGFLLDFVLQEIGPLAYNQAIRDAQAFVQDKLVDLESVCYEPEETFWTGMRDAGGGPGTGRTRRG